MKKCMLLWLVVIGVLFLAACTAGTPAPLTSSSQGTIPSLLNPGMITNPAKPDWEMEWEKVVKTARLEGRVVVYISGQFVGARESLMRALKGKYGINLEMISASSSEIAERLLRERKAGIFSVDVLIAGSSSFIQWYIPEKVIDPLEPSLLLPEVLDPKVWIGERLRFIDPQKQVFAFAASLYPQFFINTDQVKEEELKTFRDLLNPKWSGKIVVYDPKIPGPGQKAVSVIGSTLLGWDAVRSLARQDPVITRDYYQHVELVAKGKYPIAAFIQNANGEELQRAGAPVKVILLSDVGYASAGACLIGIVNQAAHPAAARVLINWLLSKEGQTTVYRDMGAPSARVDVPIEGISPLALLDPAKKYFDSDNIEWAQKQPERSKEIVSIFTSPVSQR